MHSQWQRVQLLACQELAFRLKSRPESQWGYQWETLSAYRSQWLRRLSRGQVCRRLTQNKQDNGGHDKQDDWTEGKHEQRSVAKFIEHYACLVLSS
jgi:hypothetical protein